MTTLPRGSRPSASLVTIAWIASLADLRISHTDAYRDRHSVSHPAPHNPNTPPPARTLFVFARRCRECRCTATSSARGAAATTTTAGGLVVITVDAIAQQLAIAGHQRRFASARRRRGHVQQRLWVDVRVDIVHIVDLIVVALFFRLTVFVFVGESRSGRRRRAPR